MNKLLIIIALALLLSSPAAAYYRMTPQEMTDEQLIQQYREMNYEQGKSERRAGAYHINKPLLSILEEKTAKRIYDQKNAIYDEIKRRRLDHSHDQR